MADATYAPKVYKKQGGNQLVVASGGTLSVESGGTLDVASGATFSVGDGTQAVGDFALARGSVVVGNASGVGSALDGKGSGKVLVGDGTDVASVAISGDATLAANGALTVATVNGVKFARGQHTTVAASDTVATGLATVVSVVAVLDDDPGDDPLFVTASIGDQAGAPAAGSVLIKSWATNGTDPTPIAASTFTKKVNWIAIGT